MEFQELDNAILFEDEHLVVLNKPAGWVVNRAESYKDVTVQDWMEQKIGDRGHTDISLAPQSLGEVVPPASENPYGTPEEVFRQRGGIVHRLDKDTSGVLLLAKTPAVLVELLRQFRDRETKKIYTALVHGKVQPNEGTIRLPMERSEGDYKKFSVSVDGRMSETEYRVEQLFPGLPKGMSEKKGKSYQGFSLLTLMPKTGRTHQIRVHMAAIKHPIVGDGTYAGRKRIALDAEWCPRQFLHAKSLTFVHPVTQKVMVMEAPIAADLTEALQKLSL